MNCFTKTLINANFRKEIDERERNTVFFICANSRYLHFKKI